MRIGIRREDKGKWEKRAPLAPAHVAELLNAGFEIMVEKSEIRAYKDEQYATAGAKIVSSMDNADLILGVKEIPIEKLSPHKAYMFFSHTIKGQSHNMPTLKKFMDIKSTLIDYEKIVNEEGRRLVFFGPFAGNAGMIDALWGLGQKQSSQGHDSPLKNIKQTVHYYDLKAAKKELKIIGEEIREKGFPQEISPVIFGFTGYGNVSLGAQDILDQLPVTNIGIQELMDGNPWKEGNSHTIYKLVFTLSDLYERKDGNPFDKFDFFKNPENYKSKFKQVWRKLTMLVNAVYWSEQADRFVKRSDLKEDPGDLAFISDISCDINGAVEVTTKATTTDEPFISYQPQEDLIIDGNSADGVSILAVDNLPCELSIDATNYFGESLLPLLMQIKEIEPFDFDQWPDELGKAIIVAKGKLKRSYEYLNQYI